MSAGVDRERELDVEICRGKRAGRKRPKADGGHYTFPEGGRELIS
jgi:hypothetical protein